jgi:choloylglycine hydrolase
MAGRDTMKRLVIHILMVVLVLMPGPALDACTTFCLDDGEHLLFGRNYDWSIGVGLVMVNKTGLCKTALIQPFDAPVQWTSRYGSVTFNQYGRELPMGGMNEAGLVVECMWLQGTEYPERDERPALRELSWIQYQLDNFDSVDDIVASDSDLRITPDSAPIHFLACDRTGKAAVIEFLEGKMVAHRAEDLPFKALANSTYEKSLGYLRSLGEKDLPPGSKSSLDRFSMAARGTTEFSKEEHGEAFDHAFKILEDVSQGEFTRWSVVYDVQNRSIRFRTCDAPGIKRIDLKSFDFSCETPCICLDIDSDLTGDVQAQFVDCTKAINEKLIQESWKKTSFLKDTPEFLLKMVINHPYTFKPAKKKK